jgi:hypothetical protein
VLLIGAIAGAAVGAGIEAAAPAHEEAQALVVVNPTGEHGQGEVQSRAALVASAVVSPYVAAAARDALGRFEDPGTLREDISAVADPASGLVIVTARAGSAADAVLFANTFASQAARLAQVARSGGERVRVLGDFEEQLDWQSESSGFSAGAAGTEIAPDAKYGGSSLRIDCSSFTRCGGWVRTYQDFSPDATYEATGWARLSPGSDAPASVAMFIGNGRADGEVGRSVDLTTDWQRLDVSWRPGRPAGTAQVGFVVTGNVAADSFDVDGVLLQDATLQRPHASIPPLRPAAEVRLLESDRSITRFPARPVGDVAASGTVRAALLGALAGLGVAALGIGAGLAAAGHRAQAAG